MNAVILAGGFGSRLRPLTDDIIKPMLPLANVPMIDYTVSHLSAFNIKDFVFTLSYKPEQIIQWALGYSGITCHFSIENTPLGTLGGVKAAERFLDDTFIVASGDALENINLDAMLHKHYHSKALVTMAVKEVENTELYGVVEFDAWGTVTGFCEKPPKGKERSKYINCGIYIIEKKILKDLGRLLRLDFSKDLFPRILQEGGKISAFIHDDYWCDIGDVTSYYNANFKVSKGGFFKRSPNIERVNYSSYHASNLNNSLVSASASIIGYINDCIIGQNCFIAKTAELDRCIVLDGAEARGRHKNAIIGKDFVVAALPSMDLSSAKDIYQQNSQQNNNIFS